jgi:hypothetical protein
MTMPTRDPLADLELPHSLLAGPAEEDEDELDESADGDLDEDWLDEEDDEEDDLDELDEDDEEEDELLDEES